MEALLEARVADHERALVLNVRRSCWVVVKLSKKRVVFDGRHTKERCVGESKRGETSVNNCELGEVSG